MGQILTEYLEKQWAPVIEANPDLNIEIPDRDSSGTADAVRQVWDYIDTDNIIVSMADIITNLPMTKFMDYHIEKKADATISMKPIDEFATKYGNTILDDTGKILLFMEKPSAQEIYLSTLARYGGRDILPIINTGIYCFNKNTAYQSIMETNFMDFGKDIFPYLLENKYNLFGFVENYYWMDVGNPKTYLWANWDILREYGWPILPAGKDTLDNKIWMKSDLEIPKTVEIKPRVCIGKDVKFGKDIKIFSLSSIGDGVSIGDNTIIKRSVIWENVKIGRNCIIDESVISNGCVIGDNVVIKSDSIIGPGVVVEDEVVLESSTINSDIHIGRNIH